MARPEDTLGLDEVFLRKAPIGRLGNLLLGTNFIDGTVVKLSSWSRIKLFWLFFSCEEDRDGLASVDVESPKLSFRVGLLLGGVDLKIVSRGLVNPDKDFETNFCLRSCAIGFERTLVSFPDVTSSLLLSDGMNFEIAVFVLDSKPS